MAVKAFGTNDASTVKTWSKAVDREVLPKTLMGRFMGEGSTNIIQVKNELSKNSGDRIRMNLHYLLSGDGVTGNEVLEGNEVTWSEATDDLTIDQQRQGVRVYGNIDDQRTVYDMRATGRDQLSDWWADRIDRVCLNHLCGNAAETRSAYNGFNTITSPTTNKSIYAGSATSAATLTSADVFSYAVVDKSLLRAKLLHETYGEPVMRPLRIAGGSYYVMILSPEQVDDLQTDTSTMSWSDIHKAALQGGEVSGNPIFTGALGVYKGVIFFESERIPLAQDSGTAVANTKSAVMLGAQAAWMGYGRSEYGRPEKMKWVEETFDFQNEHGIAAGMIWGVKKAVFNSVDHAAIVVNTYAAE
jgi:N4-gp56 family major capsid protein